MGRRRQARELALKMLFQIDLGNLKADEVVPHFLEETNASSEVLDYAIFLTHEVVKELPDLDALISKHAHNCKLSRIAGVDRNVLRIAAYELLRCLDIPVNVIIDEAIEVVKTYSTEESGAFVNGILDKLQGQRPQTERP